MRWFCHDLMERRRYVFEVLGHVRLPLLPAQLLERAVSECSDVSLKVALRSIRNDIVARRGSLVPFIGIKPRLAAKKDIFLIGGSKRELVSITILLCPVWLLDHHGLCKSKGFYFS
jgi:actin-binding protein IPP